MEKTADPPRDTAMPVTALHIQQKQSYLKNINIHVYKKKKTHEMKNLFRITQQSVIKGSSPGTSIKFLKGCGAPAAACFLWIHFLIFEAGLSLLLYVVTFVLCCNCSPPSSSWLTLYGSCGWKRASDFPCLPRPTSCSPRWDLRKTSPRPERLQNNTGIRSTC